MRQIKVRAWDNIEKRMHSNIEVVYDNGKCRSAELRKEDTKYLLNDCVLMQFTGLQDKNAVQIYEGDILSGWRKGSNSDLGYIGKIEWQSEQAGYIIKCHKFILEILSLAQSSWASEPYNIHQIDSFEVIGNIYENPELLSPITK